MTSHGGQASTAASAGVTAGTSGEDAGSASAGGGTQAGGADGMQASAADGGQASAEGGPKARAADGARARRRRRLRISPAWVAGIGSLAVLTAGITAIIVWIVQIAGSGQPLVTGGAPPAAAPGPGAAVHDAGAQGITSSGPVSAGPSPVSNVDHTWAARAAAATGIPDRAFLAYASADLIITKARPHCGIGWNTLAAIGTVESANGTYNGTTLLPSGYTSKPIIGARLDGGTFGGGKIAAIPDTDHGRLDGDPRFDHAVGPLQFLPSTWARWGTDGNGDGVASPDQIDDAALTAARYLCASGSMSTAAGWRAAVFSYNNSDDYVNEVAVVANRYATQTSGLS